MRSRFAGAVAALLIGASALSASTAHADGERKLSRPGCDSFQPTWTGGVCIWYDEYDQGAGISLEWESINSVPANNWPTIESSVVLSAGNGGSDGAGRPLRNNAGSAWDFGPTLAATFCVNSYYNGNRDRITAGNSDYHLANGLWHNEASMFWSY
jgi:hypothetical protein